MDCVVDCQENIKQTNLHVYQKLSLKSQLSSGRGIPQIMTAMLIMTRQVLYPRQVWA